MFMIGVRKRALFYRFEGHQLWRNLSGRIIHFRLADADIDSGRIANHGESW